MVHMPPIGAQRAAGGGFIGGPKTRLLVCDRCQSIDLVPPFNGDSNDDDVLMETVVDRHLVAHRDATVRMGGGTPEMRSYTVPQAAWDDDAQRKQIIDKLREEHKHTGIGDSWYSFRDQYREDALSCFAAHHRPQNGCHDYMDESKRIGNPTITASEAKEADREAQMLLGVARGSGLTRRMTREAATYLCKFCPVHTMAIQRRRDSHG